MAAPFAARLAGPAAALVDSIKATADAAGDRAQRSVRNRNSTIFFGDSITANGWKTDGTYAADANGSYFTGGTFARTEDYGYAAWADFLSNGAFGVLDNAGIGGNTTVDMLGRVSTDVLAKLPTLIVDNGGTNDIVTNSTGEDVIARKGQLFDLYEGIGAAIIACEIIPRAAFTTTQIRQAIKVNRWLHQQARARKNMRVVPAAAIFADPTSTVGAQLAARLFDNTHPNNLGAFWYGKALADAAIQLVGNPLDEFGALDIYGVWAADAIIRNNNPLMGYSTGGVANTGVTGQIANGYTCSRLVGAPTVAASIVDRPDGRGKAQRLAITFNAANDAIEFGIPSASGTFLQNRIMQATCDIEAAASSNDVVHRMHMYNAAVISGTTYQVTSLNQQDSTGRANLPFSSGFLRGRMKSPRLSLPDTAATGYSSQLRIYASAPGTVTIDVSLFQMRLWGKL